MIRNAFFAALFVATTPFAYAEPRDVDTVSIRVEFADLDLHTEAGAREMFSRLSTAARRACGVWGRSNQRDVQEFAAGRACVADALQDSVVALNAPLVARLHAAASSAPRA